jgi:DNA repair protein RecN (Recombination protein N)
MLRELRIADYAIIDDLTVRLAPGLNVLTGETGAGKSIIVGALSFCLGERVSEDVIRKGSGVCRVEARFDLGQPGPAGAKGRLRDLLGPDATEVTVSREIARDGRSRCGANGKSISVTALRELGDFLVDFHGQHEHQVILNVASHLDFLDGFGRLGRLRGEVAAGRRALAETRKKADALRRRIEEIASKQDFIRQEIGEIEKLNLKQGEDARIEEEMSLLENAEKIMQAGADATEALYDGDEAAIKQVARARQALERIVADWRGVAPLAESLGEAQVVIKEVSENLRDALARVDLDSSRLESLRERAVALDRMKRRFGKSVEEVLEHLRVLKAGLESREDLEAEAAELEARGRALAAELVASATSLSAKRKSVAVRLEKLVEGELRTLGMAGGGFRVVFEAVEDGDPVETAGGPAVVVADKGIDDVEFFIRTNKGEDLLPLRRIASGGEVSRVMLALKGILADADEVGTLVFDEIDSGIGGSISDVVAAKLLEVARLRQVICITHLAQIAAAAEVHLAVDKAAAGGRAITMVTEVEGERRVQELARMIAGAKPPKSALAHAEGMLKPARSR